jgi:hypothetical protein
VRPEEGQATATVWEEARKALTAVAWSQDRQPLRITIRNSWRELTPDLVVLAESTRTYSGRSNRPYRARPAAELAEQGYVRKLPNGDYDFLAPDADVLFSDEFLNGHCFRLEEGRGDAAGYLGLAFEPVERDRADIRGTLWLDRESAELQFVEFRYLNTPLPAESDRVGGRVEFVGLPNGVWMVYRWYLRMPEFHVVSQSVVPDIGQIAAGRAGVRSDQRLVLAKLREQGSEVIEVRDHTGARLAGLPGGVLAGTVFDSTRGVPLIGATIRLAGTGQFTTSGPGGAFLMDDVRNGDYTIQLSHDEFPGWGWLTAASRASVRRGDTTNVALSVPPAERLYGLRCPEHTAPDSIVGAAAGMVRDAVTRRPAPGVRIQFWWEQFDIGGGDVVRGQQSGYESVSDSEGRFLVCGLPANEMIEPRAVDGPWEAGAPAFLLRQHELREVVLTIDRR